VPQRWFLHFYLVGAAANALALSFFLLPSSSTLTDPSSYPHMLLPLLDAEALVALALFQVHLVRRALETALLLRYPPNARMHAIAYAFGLSYYLVAPLSLLPRGWSRRVLEDGMGSGFSAAAAAAASASALREAASAKAQAAAATLAASGAWRMHLAGILLFVAANALQLASHAALARLSAEAQSGKKQQRATAAAATPPSSRRLRDTPARRRHRGEEEHEQEAPYALPKGPLFALVSCPHYSAEVLLYAALALLTRLRSRLPLLMALWVAFNLVLAARATHAWYARRFGKAYLVWGGGGAGGAGRRAPWWRRRRALVPFLM
jgi:3-oxo-5-alpha-steroid 4-dehydrogenase 3